MNQDDMKKGCADMFEFYVTLYLGYFGYDRENDTK